MTPLCFKASENGTYTLAIDADNIEMSYLHLIDNLTGTDTDLLATSNYTFEAKTTDYASRFRLLFRTNDVNDATFAYFNGNEWTINNEGDATLQLIDMMGCILSCQNICGEAKISINQPAGLYVIRLVNGDNNKTQKIVIK